MKILHLKISTGALMTISHSKEPPKNIWRLYKPLCHWLNSCLPDQNCTINEKAIQVMKECENRSEQSRLMLSALLNQCEHLQVSIPSFNEEGIDHIGPRTTYQAQLRSPWADNRISQRQREIKTVVEAQRAYNRAR